MSSRQSSRNQVATDASLNDRGARGSTRRQVLIVGELGVRVRSDLAERGATLSEVPSVHDGFVALAERAFDVVVVNPHTDGCGVDLCTAIKEGVVEHQLTVATLYGGQGSAPFLRGAVKPTQSLLVDARAKHRLTPFVILSADETWHYAVIVAPPEASVMRDSREQPLVATIMTISPAELLGASGPMA